MLSSVPPFKSQHIPRYTAQNKKLVDAWNSWDDVLGQQAAAQTPRQATRRRDDHQSIVDGIFKEKIAQKFEQFKKGAKDWFKYKNPNASGKEKWKDVKEFAVKELSRLKQPSTPTTSPPSSPRLTPRRTK